MRWRSKPGRLCSSAALRKLGSTSPRRSASRLTRRKTRREGRGSDQVTRCSASYRPVSRRKLRRRLQAAYSRAVSRSRPRRSLSCSRHARGYRALRPRHCGPRKRGYGTECVRSESERRPAEIKPYLEAVHELNPDGKLRYYPGSPLIAKRFAREDDRIVLVELNKTDQLELQSVFERERHVAVRLLDGYESLKAYLPPAERRGLVLIDSSLDRARELDRIVKALKAAHARWTRESTRSGTPDGTRRHADFSTASRAAASQDPSARDRSARAYEGARASSSRLRQLVVNPRGISTRKRNRCSVACEELAVTEKGMRESTGRPE